MVVRKKFKQTFMAIIGFGILAAAVFLTYFLLNTDDMTDEQYKFAYFAMGYLYGSVEKVLNYYFGSSNGSDEKTELINRILDDNYVESLKKGIAGDGEEDVENRRFLEDEK